MEQVVVKLENRSYSIFIESGLFNNASFFLSLLNRGDRVLFITDDHVAPMYLDVLRNLVIQLGFLVVDQLILSDGEHNKSLVGLNKIFTKLLIQKCDRNTVLIALGGGVIGDLTGFAASIYQRGIRFIQIPTTLLAQVDASIGGKTGVNHILGKNMIGSYHQPMLVCIDLDFLNTLTVKEFSAGLSEVIKYAVAFDSVFFSWLEHHLDDLLSLNMKSLMYCVRRCCEIKASIVSDDEREEIGIRSLLNLGHTYGHAIESYLGYTRWSHGEAVSAGIMMAVSTAVRLEYFDYVVANRIKSLFVRAGLPICGPKEMAPIDYLEYMSRDKKSLLGQINVIVPTSIGSVKKIFDIERDLILSAITDNLN